LSLSGPEVTYTPKEANSSTQLEASPITILASPIIYQFGNTIAVNKNYICYSVKGNLIRVINKYTAQRTLIKGHTDQITDMKFFSNEVDILASVGKDGNIFVWKITEVKADEQPIIVTTLLHIKPQDKPVPQTRLTWHPSAQILATLGEDNAAYIWDVESLLVQAEGNAVLPFPNEATPSQRKITRESQLHDLSFSPDGKQVALAEQSGVVSLWDISDARQDPQCVHSWQAHESNPVSAALYCPIPSDSDQPQNILITGGLNNSQLRLWDMKTWDCLQTLDFQPTLDTKEFYNHIRLEPPFVIVANSKGSSLYVLHLDLPSEATEAGSEGADAERPNFDYVTEFSVSQPVLSFVAIKVPVPTNPSQSQTDLYCVQTKVIHMYHLKPELCYSAQKKKERRALANSSQGRRAATPVPSPAQSHVSTTTTTTTTTTAEQQQEPEIKQEQPVQPETSAQEAEEKKKEEDVDRKEEGSSTEEPTKEAVDTEKPETEEPSEEKPEEKKEAVEPSVPEPKESQDEKPVTPEGDEAEQSTQEATAEPDNKASDEAKPAEGEDQLNLEAVDASTTESGEGEASVTPPSPFELSADEEEKKGDADGCTGKEDGGSSDSDYQAGSAGAASETTESEEAKAAVPPSASGEGEAIAKGQTTPKGSKALNNKQANLKKKKTPKKNNTTFVKVGAREPESTAPGASTPSTPPTEQAASPVSNGKNRAAEGGSKDLRKELKNLENSLSARMERILQQNVDRQFARWEKERHEKEKAEREQQQRLLAAISQTLNVTVSQNVEKIIQRELQGSVVPAVQKLLVNSEKGFIKSMQEEMKKYVGQAMGNRIAALEATIKEAVSAQLAEGAGKGPAGSNVDALTEKLVAAIRQPVQESFRDYFKEMLIPSFESSCQKMFQQISHNFDSGIQQTFEGVAQRSRDLQLEASRGATSEAEAALLGQLGSAVHTLVDISANLNNSIIQTQGQLIQQLSQFGGRDAKEKEKEADRPSRNPRAEIDGLLAQERFEQAFTFALGERDLGLVTWLCSRLEPRGFFLLHRQPLSQVTLLSLLQQLGFELSVDPIIKLSWLTEIATQLNPKDEAIQWHVASLLENLLGNVQSLAVQAPGQFSGGEGIQVAGMCRVLGMIVQSLLDTTAATATTPRSGGGGSLSHSYSGVPTSSQQQQAPPGFAQPYRY